MTSRLAGRLNRLAARLPPPRGPGQLTEAEEAELAALSPEQLMARWSARSAAWEASPAGREWSRWLAGLTDDELLAEWARRPC